jgi:UDP-N-acetylmuramoyl-L-alanyl-D-glutamate--2,6-diaminopimelate ligase
VIGTINYHFAGQVLPAERTTPESLDLQRTLGEMVAGGADYVVMEVSSHSLELARVAGCEFDLAIFTNLTPDHLDFHRDLDRYLGAKLRLFSELGRSRAKETRKLALINMDDPSAPEVAQATSVETWGYGRKNNSRLMATDLELSLAGTRLRARTPRGELSLQSRLIGEHNAYNILAAVGAGIWGEVPSSQIVEGIARVDRIPGRWERVDSGRGFTVVVDYAHTGDALERTLRAARGLCRGRVITVFGCGGDRDRTKRPVMGEVAAKYSDYFIITSDNPRSEDPLAIISEIEAGVKKAYPGRDNYVKMEDRKEAIAEAIGMAKDEDLIIIAGKGHESYQILREGIIPFDDREVARSLLSKKLRRER